jgi:peptidoglycan hydrolase CwlO-like protein
LEDNKTNKKLIKNKKIIFLGLSVLFVFAFVVFQQAKAENSTAKKIKELEEKAKIYQQIIDIKQKQETTLNNQVELLEAEVGKLESETEAKKSEIDELNFKITQLGKQIDSAEESIELQKKILADLLQVYYENKDQQDAVSAFLSDKNLSSFMSRNDRMVQVEDKTSEILKNIKSLKDGLTQEKKSVEDKKKEVTDLFNELQEKSSELQDKKDQKESLITQTQGEQDKYEKLLERVESQKQELLNIDELGGGISADDYKKPPSSAYASTSWYYSQRDSRWANEKIGVSSYYMKGYGCAITSVAMISRYYSSSVTPKTILNKTKFNSNAFMPWSSVSGTSWSKIKLIKNTNHSGVNWNEVDSYLKEDNPVIVYIKKTKGDGGHYVVIHTKMSNGKYVVHDPYWGSNLYLDTSRSLVGSLSPSSGTTIDQMIIYK